MNLIISQFLNHLEDNTFREEFNEYINQKLSESKISVKNAFLKQIESEYSENVDFYIELFEKISQLEGEGFYKIGIRLLDFIIIHFLLNRFETLPETEQITEGMVFEDVDELNLDITGIRNQKNHFYIQRLKNIKEIIVDDNLKAVLLRKLSWLEPDETMAVDMLKEALFLSEDKDELKFIYYELIQRLLSVENFDEAEQFLKTAKEQYEDDDAFYEMDGHFGMLYYEDGEVDTAKKYLDNVYQWLIYRSMDSSLNKEFLTSNFIVFLDTYASIFVEEKNLDKAVEIYSFSFDFIKSFINTIYENNAEENLKVIMEANLEDFLTQYAKFLAEKEGKKSLGYDILYFEILKHELLSVPSLNEKFKESIESFQFNS